MKGCRTTPFLNLPFTLSNLSHQSSIPPFPLNLPMPSLLMPILLVK